MTNTFITLSDWTNKHLHIGNYLLFYASVGIAAVKSLLQRKILLESITLAIRIIKVDKPVLLVFISICVCC